MSKTSENKTYQTAAYQIFELCIVCRSEDKARLQGSRLAIAAAKDRPKAKGIGWPRA